MFKSIKLKLTIIVSFIVLLALCGLGSLNYFQTLSKVESLLGKKVESIAKTTSTLLSFKKHEKLKSKISAAGDSKEYKSIQKALAKVQKINNLQEGLYTLMDAHWVKPSKEEPYGKIVFTALSSKKEFELKGQKKEKYVHDALTLKKSGYTKIFQTENGHFITGYSPIVNTKGKVSGLVEVALEVGKEISAARTELIQLILKGFGIAIFVAILLTLFAANSFSSPIVSLTGVVEKMAGGNFSSRAENIKGKDEIAKLSHGFNHMAENLEKSYKELENYSKNLEAMVNERTEELAAANEKITVMLNSMSLGVFVVNDELKIVPPYSKFAQSIFEIDLEGCNVYETIYSEVKEDAETYTNLQTALLSVFGEDDLQWMFMEENLVQKFKYRVPSDGSIKSLKASYSPLYDKEGLVKNILFVVEDITEIERLEEEARKVKAESEETNAILTQISNMDLDDLVSYFQSNKTMIEKNRKVVVNEDDPAFLSALFRDLHTLKGNSRIYKLNIIAKKVHEVEESVKGLKEKFKSGKVTNLEDSDKNSLLNGFEEIVVAIGKYSRLASRIFKIENLFLEPNPQTLQKNLNYYLSVSSSESKLAESEQKILQIAEIGDSSELKKSIKRDESIDEKQFKENLALTCIKLSTDSQFSTPLNKSLNNMIPLYKSFFAVLNDLLSLNETGSIQNFNNLELFAKNCGFEFIEETSKQVVNEFDFNKGKEAIYSIWRLLETMIWIEVNYYLSESQKNELNKVLNNFLQSNSIDELNQFRLEKNSNLLTLAKTFSRNDQNFKTQIENLDKLFQEDASISRFFSKEHLSETSFTEEINLKVEIINNKVRYFIPFCDNINYLDKALLDSKDIENYHLFLSDFYKLLNSYNFKNNPSEKPKIVSVLEENIVNLNLAKTAWEKNQDIRNTQSFIARVNQLMDISIGSVVFKYYDMISSLSGKLGKQISFNIIGNELTYNRDVLYSIDEALLHLLRNAIDHGIENQEERVNTGKEALGNIILKFEKDIEGKLLVEINDDGKGINIEEIKTKIIEKEFSSAEEIKDMSEQEILSFILKPDFSTKEQVTDVSGRGVGMDVVNSNIAKLGGKLIINSELGKGTNFTIEL